MGYGEVWLGEARFGFILTKGKNMESLRKYKISLKSLTPLIMHSDRLCNPLDPLAKQLKEISSIKKKTDDHHLAMARLSWEGSLYYEKEVGVYMPTKCLLGCFKAAAKKYRLGKQSKAIFIDLGIGCTIWRDEEFSYKNTTPEQLWRMMDSNDCQVHVHCASVVVQNSRLMRYRPIFPKWQIEFESYLNTELLNEKDFRSIIETAGMEMGIGELRPELANGNFGRFELIKIKEVK